MIRSKMIKERRPKVFDDWFAVGALHSPKSRATDVPDKTIRKSVFLALRKGNLSFPRHFVSDRRRILWLEAKGNAGSIPASAAAIQHDQSSTPIAADPHSTDVRSVTPASPWTSKPLPRSGTAATVHAP
jgi:hypothetical protein